jgi:hypothetical protein
MTTITTPISPAEHAVREIVGRAYDRGHPGPPERFQPGRALMITAIPTAYFANEVAIALGGTPTRGLVIVTVAYYPPAGIDTISGRFLAPSDAMLLRNFVCSISGELFDRMPRDFRWSSCGA